MRTAGPDLKPVASSSTMRSAAAGATLLFFFFFSALPAPVQHQALSSGTLPQAHRYGENVGLENILELTLLLGLHQQKSSPGLYLPQIQQQARTWSGSVLGEVGLELLCLLTVGCCLSLLFSQCREALEHEDLL